MIKNKLALIIGAVLASQMMAVQAAQPDADVLIGQFNGGLHGAYLGADNDRLAGPHFDKGLGLGIEGGYRLSAPIELRLSYTRFNADLNNGGSIDGINKYSFDALYFATHKNLYLLGGVNGVDFDSGVEPAANLGLGYRHYFTNQLSAYVEGKANHQFSDDGYTDMIAQTGLVYFFGQNKTNQSVVPEKAAVVVIADNDKDGIPDDQDKCLTSAANAKVDSMGCAIFMDADKDGIEDSKDKCLTSQANETVDAMGCAVVLDADKDGVLDSEDKCLATPENNKVDAMGCTVFAEEDLSYRLSVNFDNNKTNVKSEYYGEMQKVADFLNKYPQVEVTIDGYSSTQGRASYNKKLSQQRADAVAALLADKYGIDKTRMKAMGHGEVNLIDKRDTKEAHQTNRRIELNIVQ